MVPASRSRPRRAGCDRPGGSGDHLERRRHPRSRMERDAGFGDDQSGRRSARVGEREGEQRRRDLQHPDPGMPAGGYLRDPGRHVRGGGELPAYCRVVVVERHRGAQLGEWDHPARADARRRDDHISRRDGGRPVASRLGGDVARLRRDAPLRAGRAATRERELRVLDPPVVVRVRRSDRGLRRGSVGNSHQRGEWTPLRRVAAVDQAVLRGGEVGRTQRHLIHRRRRRCLRLRQR